MSIRASLRISLSSLVLVLVACATEPPPSPPVQSDGLTLSEASKERITGVFTQNGVTVKFDSIRTPSVFSFEIWAADGRSLIKGEKIDTNFVTTILGGRLALFYGDADDAGILHQGDPSAMDELERTPEYALLPWLSYQLGTAGYNGRDYPSVLAMHMFNRSVAERLDIAVPAVAETPSAVFPREEGYCSRPTANNCYGMCGPGCTCWSFVCGDCCYHSGCANHDNYCRGSGFSNTAKCWTYWGAAFFGC